MNFYDGDTDDWDGETTLPYDPSQSSGGYIPETTIDPYALETIPK